MSVTQIPNGLLDDVLPEINSLGELKVTLVVARQTVGRHRQQAPLTLTQIQQLSGLSRPTASRGLQDALHRGTVSRLVLGKSFVYEVCAPARRELP